MNERRNSDRSDNAGQREVATLGGGCFWCLDAVYRMLKGVERVQSGYAGGHVSEPSYRDVCSGSTGHAEVVQVTFDPAEITFRDILDVFFTVHDPTTLNRQGADVGSQYRSIILYHSPAQLADAERAMEELEASGAWDAPIVTELQPLTTWFAAESEHQDYYARNPSQAYCAVAIAPKIAKLRKRHLERLRA
jgi:peptide-methionine (S)-S-oxide reductase